MISTIGFLYFESNGIFSIFFTDDFLQNTWSLFSSHK